ncbi:MAG TPA: tonB-system energizer ExbB [Dongiaceae bacterium]
MTGLRSVACGASPRGAAVLLFVLSCALAMLPCLAFAQDTGAGGTLAPASAIGGTAIGTLPHDLSPWNMFLSADLVVKAVMISLAIASIVTWTVLVAKTMELAAAKHEVRSSLAILNTAHDLNQAAQQFQARSGGVAALVHAAVAEANLSADVPGEGLKERVVSRLERIEAGAGRTHTFGTNALATIGATAPFVGLFGTVWGIMNAFVGISKAQTTNLAVVAPGIAEALLATALGLIAAIPAVMIYNHFARSISGYRSLMADASAAVLRLVSRDLDRLRAGIPTHPDVRPAHPETRAAAG